MQRSLADISGAQILIAQKNYLFYELFIFPGLMMIFWLAHSPDIYTSQDSYVNALVAERQHRWETNAHPEKSADSKLAKSARKTAESEDAKESHRFFSSMRELSSMISG